MHLIACNIAHQRSEAKVHELMSLRRKLSVLAATCCAAWSGDGIEPLLVMWVHIHFYGLSLTRCKYATYEVV